MRFELDEQKNQSNQEKHGLSFELASRVFDDPYSLSVQDRWENGEERWQTMGLIDAVLVVLLAHTVGFDEEENEEVIRAQPERQPKQKGNAMTKLSGKQKAELKRLQELPDEADLSDIPERLDWSNAEIGKFYRPIKQSVTMRLDADVLEWFKANSDKYQSRINQVLRQFVTEQRKRPQE